MLYSIECNYELEEVSGEDRFYKAGVIPYELRKIYYNALDKSTIDMVNVDWNYTDEGFSLIIKLHDGLTQDQIVDKLYSITESIYLGMKKDKRLTYYERSFLDNYYNKIVEGEYLGIHGGHIIEIMYTHTFNFYEAFWGYEELVLLKKTI